MKKYYLDDLADKKILYLESVDTTYTRFKITEGITKYEGFIDNGGTLNEVKKVILSYIDRTLNVYNKEFEEYNKENIEYLGCFIECVCDYSDVYITYSRLYKNDKNNLFYVKYRSTMNPYSELYINPKNLEHSYYINKDNLDEVTNKFIMFNEVQTEEMVDKLLNLIYKKYVKVQGEYIMKNSPVDFDFSNYK